MDLENFQKNNTLDVSKSIILMNCHPLLPLPKIGGQKGDKTTAFNILYVPYAHCFICDNHWAY